MTCKTIHSLLLDYTDGDLGAAQRALVQAHLQTCATCAGQIREAAAARSLLQSLPSRQTSAHFETRLSERLAQERRPAPRTDWWKALTGGVPQSFPALRPAFALGAAVIAVAGVLAYHPATTVPPPAVPAVDTALISQCVALHQHDVAAQPLSDAALQNVTGHDDAWNGDTTAGTGAEGSL